MVFKWQMEIISGTIYVTQQQQFFHNDLLLILLSFSRQADLGVQTSRLHCGVRKL